MVGRSKAAPKRKRGLSASTGAKKKQTTAAKKKHVRELAKASRWAEIERLYGKKILLKAKTYAEKHCVQKTPQDIARDILLKNGYLSAAPQASAAAAVAPAGGRKGHASERVNAEPPATLQTTTPSSGTLTKEQQERIEKRRQEALERRKRSQQVTQVRAPAVVSIQSTGNEAKTVWPRLEPSIVPEAEPSRQHCALPAPTKSACVQHSGERRRVVTPEYPVTRSSEPENDELRLWDDMEAAAEIVQWEKDHMAEVTLDQARAKHVGGFHRQNVIDSCLDHSENENQVPRAPKVPSLTQELAAAAEVVQWELEHEVSTGSAPQTRCAVSFATPIAELDSDPELEAPQFLLLSASTSSDLEHGQQKTVQTCPRDRANLPSRRTRPNNELQADKVSRRKRPQAAAAPPSQQIVHCSLPSDDTVVKRAATSIEKKRSPNTSLASPQIQHDPTAAFVKMHLLEDKLELPVLEFLDMMLA